MAHDHVHGGGEHCSCALQPTGAQTILELEFERGIWSAAMDGERERVKKFLGRGIDPSSVDSAGYTALHYASRSGHVDVCRLLLSSGAKVNVQTPGGVTPLHRAAYCGHVGVVRTLLDGGAKVTLVDSDGKTPLHKAAEKGRTAVAKLLLPASRESTGTKDKRGHLPVDLIPEDPDMDDLRQLLSQ